MESIAGQQIPATPGVSVVMGVYNAENSLSRTLESLDAQRPKPLEIIVVDDGSADGTAELLESWCNGDSTRRVLRTGHQGLTAALATGCAGARGKYIARQDAGDVSLPDRLAQQVEVLDRDDDVVMVSTGTEFLDAEGGSLYEVVMSGDDAMAGLETTRSEEIIGPPHHGSVMFRRDAYLAVGGYRKAFYVAQDIDLWLRLVEQGRHVSLGHVLYRADASPSAISFSRRTAQQLATRLALQARACRRQGEPETEVLREALAATRIPARIGRAGVADYHYFVAGCRRRSQPAVASRHYRRALAANPMHWRALVRMIQCLLATIHGPPPAK